MQTVQGDQAAIIAATLTQAECALRGGRAVGAKTSPLQRPARSVVEDAYAFYLHLVTTGAPPEKK